LFFDATGSLKNRQKSSKIVNNRQKLNSKIRCHFIIFQYKLLIFSASFYIFKGTFIIFLVTVKNEFFFI